MGLAAAMEEDRNAYSAQRAQEAAERKNWRGEQREALDELLPKATAGRCGLCPTNLTVLTCSFACVMSQARVQCLQVCLWHLHGVPEYIVTCNAGPCVLVVHSLSSLQMSHTCRT